MAGYIGKIQIGDNAAVLIGSTLYGICTSPAAATAKTVTSSDNNSGKFINNNYDNLMQGTTIHIKFTQGNSVTSSVTLQIGTTGQAQQVIGICACDPGTILSFTLDESSYWVANDNVNTITEYEFMTAYNASTNKIATEADLADLNIQAAAHKGIISSDLGNHTASSDLPTAAAVAAYVQNATGGLSGLTGAMHFRGTATAAIEDGDGPGADPNISGYSFHGNSDNAGDVVLWNGKEFVWTGTRWEELGDEGSFALKSSTDTITEVSEFTANRLPTLTVTPVNIPNVTSGGTAANLTTDDYTIPNVTSTNIPTTTSVSNGILTITPGQAAVLGTAFDVKSVKVFTANTPAQLGTEIQIGSASNWNAGTQAQLDTTDTIVVVPDSSP